MKSPYDILGVPLAATAEEIKRAFRRLARERHPDRHPDDPDAEEAFKELSAAYDLLSDPETRARFDAGVIDARGQPRARPKARSGGAGRRWHGRSPFDRMFERDGETAEPARGVKINGANVTYSVKVGFLDAARGTTLRVNMAGATQVDVRIPPGTRDGRVLRLKGQGMGGLGGGTPGDALVEVAVEPHPFFTADGADIRVEVPVTLPEAVLGGRIEVPTVDGPVAVGVPAGSNTGTILRLRGKGLADADGGARGDQYVKLRVVLPAVPDKELTDFVARWASRNPYEVRRETVGT